MNSSKAVSPSPITGRANLIARKKWSGCLHLDDFKLEEKLGEGTFGIVYKATHRRTKQVYALKKILLRPEQEGFPITALREIKLLKLVRHPNAMSITDVAVSSGNVNDENGGVYMVFPYLDHDLTGLLECPDIIFSIPQIKLYMKQLLSGLKYLHSVQILHRDIKGANLLINNSGELRITDFGLARPIEEQRVHYTPGVVTRWYRPPELLFGATKYTTAVDMWGAGCILGEMFTKKPLLPGDSDLHQLELITKLCGTPTEETMPGCSDFPDFGKVKLPMYKRRVTEMFLKYDPTAADLINGLLALDPKKRLTASEALNHAFFKQPPLAMLPSDCPTYPSKHEFTALKHAPHPTPQEHGGPSSFEPKPASESKESRKDKEVKSESKRERPHSRSRSRHRSRSHGRSRSRERYLPRPYFPPQHPADRFYDHPPPPDPYYYHDYDHPDYHHPHHHQYGHPPPPQYYDRPHYRDEYYDRQDRDHHRRPQNYRSHPHPDDRRGPPPPVTDMRGSRPPVQYDEVPGADEDIYRFTSPKQPRPSNK